MPCFGLAAAGEAGLERVLEILEDEVRICLGLLGAPDWSALDRSCVHAATPVVPPFVTSAFPLLGEGY
jgi:glycolate oxidase